MSAILKSLLAGCTLVLFAGCANMPDMKNIPGGGSSVIAGLLPGKLGQVADAGVKYTQASAEADREISEAEEIAIGERLMSGILGAAPLYANERMQRYVNQVGRTVASRSERPNLPWRFALLDSPLVNAGAAPGGQIYLTTGLLFRMRSEAELAGTLAHEVAHVVQKHHLKLYQREKKGAAAKSIGASAASSAIKVGGGALGQAAKNVVIDIGLDFFKSFILTPLDRGEEYQADRMGMILAARAGYDPFGLPSTLQILQDVSKDQGGLSVLFSTHPDPVSRLDALDKALGQSMSMYATQATLQDRFYTMIVGAPPPSEKPSSATKPAPTKAPAKAVPKKTP